MTRVFLLTTIGCATLALVLSTSPAVAQTAGPTTAPAAHAPSLFDHLPRRDGGPTWTIDSIAGLLPPGGTLTLDSGKPIPPVKDVPAALRTAILALRSAETARHELAFRLVGAAENQTHDVNATKLFALLQHHGIGTRADSGAAVRTALDAVRVGDREAAEFVARDSPKAFASIAKSVTSVKRLADLPSPSVVKLSAPIVTMEGQKLTVGAAGDKPMPLELTTLIDKLKVGRVVTIAGMWENGKLAALVGEVPEPSLQFKWELIRKPIRRGEWRLQTVKVAVMNKGLQPIKGATLKVQCRMRGSYTQRTTARCDALAAGATDTLTVNFNSYYDYFEATGMPEAEVTIEEIEW